MKDGTTFCLFKTKQEIMAKEVGAEALGRFFTDGKVRSRREWRGFKDTFYDYTRWLYIMKQLAGFIIKPRNIKAMFRYRWMATI